MTIGLYNEPAGPYLPSILFWGKPRAGPPRHRSADGPAATAPKASAMTRARRRSSA